MSFLTGKPAKSTSSNQSFPWAQQNFGGSSSGAYSGGLGGIMGLMGMGGDPNQANQSAQNFWNNTGGKFLLNQGTDAVNANMYARGLGQSGADMKGLEDYRQGLASTKLNDMMQNYLGIAKLGLGGGQLVTDAGQQSQSRGPTQGIGAMLGTALSFIPKSDRRSKTEIKRVGTLGVYEYRYHEDAPGTVRRGVMADEIDEHFPEASGPTDEDGYRTVNYPKLIESEL